MKILIPKKKYLFLIFFFILLSLPVVSSAALKLNLEYPSFTVGGETFDLNTTQHLNQVVVWFYYFIVAVAGFSAFVMLVWGGVEWLVSAGNPTKTSSAKERITSAVTGLLIILVSFLILQTINPELTTLTFPETREAAPWPSPPDNGTGPDPDPDPSGFCPGVCGISTTCWSLGGKCHENKFECGSCCCVEATCWDWFGQCKSEAQCISDDGWKCREYGPYECSECCCAPDFSSPDPDPDPECIVRGGDCTTDLECSSRGGGYECTTVDHLGCPSSQCCCSLPMPL